MKKIMSLIMVLILLSTFTGCGKNEEYTIGIVQIVEHASLDTIRESIIEELEQQGYKHGDNIKIDYKNAQGDQSNLSTIVQGFVIEEAKAIALAYGYTYEELAISELSELKQAVETLLSRVDALYVPIDNTIASAMPVVTMAAREAKKPVYVGADSLVEEGGYATVGINYEQLGIQTAQMIIEVIEGEDVATMPVQTLDQYYTVINRTTAHEIGAKSEIEGAIIVD